AARNRDIRSFPTRRSSDLLGNAVPELELRRGAATLDEGREVDPVPGTGFRQVLAVGLVLVADVRAPGEGGVLDRRRRPAPEHLRSEEHTSELQSRENLVCR